MKGQQANQADPLPSDEDEDDDDHLEYADIAISVSEPQKLANCEGVIAKDGRGCHVRSELALSHVST